jgi:hypothetical protein
MLGTDGSLQDPTATYSCVISIFRIDVKPNVKGEVDSFPPVTAPQDLDPYSKRLPKRQHSLLGFAG